MTSWTPPDESDGVDEAARAWYLRLVSGDARREEVVALERWLASAPDHEAAFRRTRDVYGSAVRRPLAIARKVERRIGRQRRLALAGTACGALLAFTMLPSWNSMFADHASKVGVVERLALPDGTIAMLDTQSSLDVDFDDRFRTVKLRQGRAWFKVAKGTLPFRVEAAGGEVRDIGTAFSVDIAHQKGLEVGVEQGIVDVSVDGRTRRLERGMQAVFPAEGEPVLAPAAVDAFRWREGRLSFSGRPLGEVLEEIGRYRPGIIYLSDKSIANRRVSALLSLDALDSGLAGLAANQGLTLRQITPWLLIVSPER